MEKPQTWLFLQKSVNVLVTEMINLNRLDGQINENTT